MHPNIKQFLVFANNFASWVTDHNLKKKKKIREINLSDVNNRLKMRV